VLDTAYTSGESVAIQLRGDGKKVSPIVPRLDLKAATYGSGAGDSHKDDTYATFPNMIEFEEGDGGTYRVDESGSFSLKDRCVSFGSVYESKMKSALEESSRRLKANREPMKEGTSSAKTSWLSATIGLLGGSKATSSPTSSAPNQSGPAGRSGSEKSSSSKSLSRSSSASEITGLLDTVWFDQLALPEEGNVNVDLLPIIFSQMRMDFDPRQLDLWQRQVTHYNGRSATPKLMSYGAVCEIVLDKMALYGQKPAETPRDYGEANLIESFRADSFHLRAEGTKLTKNQHETVIRKKVKNISII
jgi:hypothetical protein